MTEKIPEGWEVCSFEDMKFEVSDGNYSSKYPKQSDFVPEGIPFIRANNLKNQRIIWDDMRFISKEQHSELKKGHLKIGDILLSTRGQIGTVAIVSKEFDDANINAQLIRINTKGKMNNKYFLYYLESPFAQKNLLSLTTGTALQQLPVGKLKLLPIIKPSLPEQEKIADILSKTDEQIQLTEEIIAKTEELKKGLMQELLTKGIGHTEFKEVKIGHNLYSLPISWKIIYLSEINADKNGIVAGPFGSNLKVDDYKDKGIPIIRLQNVQRNIFLDKDMKYISEEKAEELKYHSFKAEDIVLAKLGIPVGKTCKVPLKYSFGIVVADVVRIRPDKKIVNNDFIEYMLNFDLCGKQLTQGIIGSTRPRVNLSDVRNLRIPLPPLQEQEKIASILLSLDNQIQDNRFELKRLQNLKQGLMQDLLTGKVRVKIC